MWGATLINRQSFDQGSLVGGGGSLYAFGNGTLDRIDPATGEIVQWVPSSPPVLNRPVVLGNTVWAMWSYSGGEITLRGYDARTLARVASVSVPAIGGVCDLGSGRADGRARRQALRGRGRDDRGREPGRAPGEPARIMLTGGQASSVAIAPDGGTLYVGISSADSFRLLAFDAGNGRIVGSSTMPGGTAGTWSRPRAASGARPGPG